MKEKLTEWFEWLGEGKLGRTDAVLVAAALYLALQVLALSLVSHWAGTGAGIDDAEQLIYAPYLWAGYGGSQPPLYTWMTWTATHLFGISIPTLKIVKNLTFFLAFLSVNLAVRKLGFSRITAAAAALGMMIVPQIFWESQHTLTHSVAALGFSALAFLAFAHLLQSRAPLAYALFGVAAALSILAKFNDIIFLAAMVGAALTVRAYRPVVLNRWLILSFGIVLLLLTPTLLWSYNHPDAVLARVSKFGIDQDDEGLFSTLTELLEAIFNFSLMPAIICGLAFALEKLNPFTPVPKANSAEKFMRRILVFGLLTLALLAFLSGTTSIRDRWLLPLLFLLPAYAVARAELFGPAGRKVQVHIIAISVIVAILAVPFTWYAQAIGGQNKSRTVRMDYRQLYSELQANGPVRTVVGMTSWIGNFRLVDSDLVLLNPEVPGFETLMREPAVLVWIDTDKSYEAAVERMRAFGYELAGPARQVTVREIFGADGGRAVTVAKLVKQSHAEAALPDDGNPVGD